ncbi:MAG: DUF1427 family protein [Chloroflexota bacterium]
MKVALGLLTAFGIGVATRVFGIPVPAPPALVGALLVVAMSLGYILADRYLTNRAATTKKWCGGPTGEPVTTATSEQQDNTS